MTFEEWKVTLLPFEAKALTRREIFQAGAASRDAEVVSLTNQRDYEYVRAENAEQERDQLRAELAAEQAKSVEVRDFIARAQVSSGVCCCGEAMDGHSSPMSCGHSPVDMWDYAVGKLLDAPSAISALEAYVAKAGEKMRTDAMQAADANNQFAAYDAIRTLPPVTLEDLK